MHSFLRPGCLLLLAAWAFPASADIQVRKLNPSLSGARDVKTIAISPDGRYVVYQADQEVDQRFELYSVSTLGAAPAVKLNGPLVAGGIVLPDFVITADGARVVFRADGEADDVYELYSAPIDGSAGAVKLDLTPAPGGDVFLFRCTPDGAQVVYLADQDVNDVLEVYVVPADGSAAPLLLSQSSVSASDAVDPVVAPDGSFVVYRNVPAGGGSELLRVPIDGSAAPLLLSVGLVHASALDPSAARVVFTATVLGRRELYGVPSDGSASPIKLSGPVFVGNVFDFSIDPTASRVAFERTSAPLASSLYSAPLDGSADPVKLFGATVTGGEISAFEFTPDGECVVFLGDAFTDERFVLQSVPADGSGGAVVLNGGLVAAGDVLEFQIAPTGARLVGPLADPDAHGDALAVAGPVRKGEEPPGARSAPGGSEAPCLQLPTGCPGCPCCPPGPSACRSRRGS